jgi:hypothetical protein
MRKKYLLKKNRLCAKWLTCKERKDCVHAKPHKTGVDSLSCGEGWCCMGGDINPLLAREDRKYGVVVFPRKPRCINLNVERYTKVWDEESHMS